MTQCAEELKKIVATRIRRRIEDGEASQELFLEDVNMLVNLILGGEA